MNFFLGTHHATQTWFNLEVPLFVSRRVLTTKKRLPSPRAEWALDSGGFTELELYGGWRTTEDEYVADVERFAEMGHLSWVAPMDWMCEPFMLRRTGLTIAEHQRRTIENFLRLRERLGHLVIPVLQGWTLEDYKLCWEHYERAGVDLLDEKLVGVGTVCRRQDTTEAELVFSEFSNVALHGFGVKLAGLNAYQGLLSSCDSMAWSYEGRRLARRHDRQDPLFPWPKRMLCGRMHPSEHRARSCSNCPEWALRWRQTIIERLEVAA